jgi:hypothetical protein
MKKSNCWLCERGYGLDNGGLSPGELHEDFFGDLICIYCEARIENMGRLLAEPKLIPLVAAISKLPVVPGYSVVITNRDREYE